jgi:major membrane immunogen (membrane-anchored lipoprotein)
MKKKLFIFSFILSQLLLGCEKNDVLDESILKGEVIRVTCASTVVQIKNAEKYGEDGWINEMSTGQVKYDNVFKVENICKVKKAIKDGTIDTHEKLRSIIGNQSKKMKRLENGSLEKMFIFTVLIDEKGNYKINDADYDNFFDNSSYFIFFRSFLVITDFDT